MRARDWLEKCLDELNSSVPRVLPEGEPTAEIRAADDADLLPKDSQALVLVRNMLQDLDDYRTNIGKWFDRVRVGGHMVLTVPHAFLDRTVPSADGTSVRRHRRRPYTPRSLLDEIEEALEPNSYRIRWLGDNDAGYTYADAREAAPVGRAEIVLIVERIELPAWQVRDGGRGVEPEPDYAFEPDRIRTERAALMPPARVLLLKLDHLGDFVMGLPALERLRSAFRQAEITLVVGSWNADVARGAGVADLIVTFDGFPRDASAREPDIRGTRSEFEAIVTGDYDLAIDLRTDIDTRFLLRSVRAKLRAGIGRRTECPYLDIFLPIDRTRHDYEIARDERISHHRFFSHGDAFRHEHRIAYAGHPERVAEATLVWGPYVRLRAGRYIFEPFVEIDRACPGTMLYDVALDQHRVAQAVLTPSSSAAAPEAVRLSFTVDEADREFEFRIWSTADAPAGGFSFFGGRLLRQGASSVLHQSEYLMLLAELVILRVGRLGMLCDEIRAS